MEVLTEPGRASHGEQFGGVGLTRFNKVFAHAPDENSVYFGGKLIG